MDLDHQELFPQENPRSPEIENDHPMIHGSRYLMWSLQFMASLSVISLFISYLTGISLYYSYTYYFSTFFLPLLTRALERKYVFLLCNSLILVFLFGFRGLTDQDHHLLDFVGEIVVSDHQGNVDDTITTPLETVVVAVDDQILETDTGSLNDEFEEPVANETNEEEEDIKEDGYMHESGYEDEKDNELVRSSSSTDEELKKKFDEFIRKMKEELRLEANDYQLIAA